MISNELLSPKEFSNIYKISRDTLEYYRKIGLLMPSEIRDNGYGLYSHEEGNTLQMIRLLKIGGCSLKEIKKLLYEGGASDFANFMEQKRNILVQRRDECDAALQILDYYQLFRRTTLELAIDEIRIVKNPDEFYILYTEVEPEYRSSPAYCAKVLLEHNKRCEELSREVLRFPVGTIHPKISDYSVDMDLVKGYCNYCIGKPKNVDNYKMIPTKQFLTYMHTSDKFTIDNLIVEKMMSFASDKGYSLLDDFYVIPFTEKIICGNKTTYYCRMFAEVEKKVR